MMLLLLCFLPVLVDSGTNRMIQTEQTKQESKAEGGLVVVFEVCHLAESFVLAASSKVTVNSLSYHAAFTLINAVRVKNIDVDSWI